MQNIFTQLITETKKKSHAEIIENLPLSRICTFRIGGPARLIITPESKNELISCLQMLRKYSIPYITVGAASNLLFDDNGFNGAVIRTKKLNTVSLQNGVLTAEAGVTLPKLCRISAESSLDGLYGLCGIPGTVGGAVQTAAGAFNCNIYDYLSNVEVYFPHLNRTEILPLTANDFSYRKAPEILKDAVILRISLHLPHSDRLEIENKMTLCANQRRATQPQNIPSAGSFFKRPENAPPAAFLIDRAGLKGTQIGDAVVSEKHAGFIVNKGNATAEQVRRLANTVKEKVYESFGVSLAEEVMFVASPTEKAIQLEN